MRILIADDDPIIRLDLRQMLESLGHEVVAECEDGRAAVELAQKEDPEVCVLDVKMPVMDGIDAANQIMEASIAPVVLLTAYSDQELINRATHAGVFGYLVKPFKPSDLSPAIEVARAKFETHLQIVEQLSTMEERLEARKAIEKAKGALMEDHQLGEAEAYRRIQLQAMNLRKSMKEVAEAILMARGV
jgi:response regulator NasT